MWIFEIVGDLLGSIEVIIFVATWWVLGEIKSTKKEIKELKEALLNLEEAILNSEVDQDSQESD